MRQFSLLALCASVLGTNAAVAANWQVDQQPAAAQPTATSEASSAPTPETTGDIVYVPPPAAGGPMPTNNMTQVKVRDSFGEPQSEQPAVGEPPITRWHYGDYTVYFEWDRVIISVPRDI
jgi:hypothetical protein